jgi:putative transposase
MSAVSMTKQTGLASTSKVCACFNLKRDAYYKYQKRFALREILESQIIELVKEERLVQPRVGTRKLYEALQTTFEAEEIKIVICLV